MASPLDLDQLQTFVAIADIGSFTRAAEEVHRTQSAVSMQMRRLEERIGKPLFAKDGRTNRPTEIVRNEPLLWVTSASHQIHEEEVLPMAFGRPTCQWRRSATDMLAQMNREHRILFTSWSATVIIAAVLSGLAVSVLPECALRPGMRVLGEAVGFGALDDVRIGILRGHTTKADIVDALARHIAESLDNISMPLAEETGSFDFAALGAVRSKRLKPGHVMAGW